MEPDTDPLAGIRERAEGMRNREVWVRLKAAEADRDRLLGAAEVLQDALRRHQHKLTDKRGDCCAGCLSDWPCPDSDAAARALLSKGETDGT